MWIPCARTAAQTAAIHLLKRPCVRGTVCTESISWLVQTRAADTPDSVSAAFDCRGAIARHQAFLQKQLVDRGHDVRDTGKAIDLIEQPPAAVKPRVLFQLPAGGQDQHGPPAFSHRQQFAAASWLFQHTRQAPATMSSWAIARSFSACHIATAESNEQGTFTEGHAHGILDFVRDIWDNIEVLGPSRGG